MGYKTKLSKDKNKNQKKENSFARFRRERNFSKTVLENRKNIPSIQPGNREQVYHQKNPVQLSEQEEHHNQVEKQAGVRNSPVAGGFKSCYGSESSPGEQKKKQIDCRPSCRYNLWRIFTALFEHLRIDRNCTPGNS